jgi:hypothetical protein
MRSILTALLAVGCILALAAYKLRHREPVEWTPDDEAAAHREYDERADQ